ncbi:hypothetical protein [Halosolutus gelatinilyticus]|uniref:hypothetical protein n=1 Tax=Halosolutus gelatinilyticus TaxID=2931975 RepID=UPI001FF2B14D|nr:hypothetical protein [Halosolutus gelatinilyticus]
MVSTETKIVAIFVVLGIVLWYGTMAATDSAVAQGVVLLGVGIIVPTIINEWREQTES